MIIMLLIANIANAVMINNIFFWILWWIEFIEMVLNFVIDILERVERHRKI